MAGNISHQFYMKPHSSYIGFKLCVSEPVFHLEVNISLSLIGSILSSQALSVYSKIYNNSGLRLVLSADGRCLEFCCHHNQWCWMYQPRHYRSNSSPEQTHRCAQTNSRYLERVNCTEYYSEVSIIFFSHSPAHFCAHSSTKTRF